MFATITRVLLPSTLLFCAACATPVTSDRTEHPGLLFDTVYQADDILVAEELSRTLEAGIDHVEEFFDHRFRKAFEVHVLASREAFTKSFPAEWGMTKTQCWMVATGVADALRILSPRVWKTDACEHDPEDAEHVRGIVVHELVHVFHGQHHPVGDFVGSEDAGWFLEGLAVFASGQLDEGHMASAQEALQENKGPTELRKAWSGKYRYGVCGSIVEFIDAHIGRDGLFALLPLTSTDAILEAVGLTEEELLSAWREYALET